MRCVAGRRLFLAPHFPGDAVGGPAQVAQVPPLFANDQQEVQPADDDERRQGQKEKLHRCKHRYLRSGSGAVDIGISWGGEVDRNGVFRWKPGGGGHALAFLGWKSIGGDMFVWMLNSWGRGWGDNGWALVHASTIEDMLRHPHTVMVGYSDLERPDNVRDLAEFIRRGGTVYPGGGKR